MTLLACGGNRNWRKQHQDRYVRVWGFGSAGRVLAMLKQGPRPKCPPHLRLNAGNAIQAENPSA